MRLENVPIARDAAGDRACLLLHGLGGGIYELEPIARALADEDFALRGPRYPGHEAPARHMPHSTWPAWYACAERALFELTRGASDGAGSARRASLCGFSTGGLLALRLAARHPDLVERVALLCPFFGVRTVLGLRLERPLEAMTALTRVPRRRLSIADPVARAAASRVSFGKTFSLVSARSALELAREVEAELDRVVAPALLVVSTRDGVVDSAAARRAFTKLGSTSREELVLERSDHAVAIDLERELVVARVTRFMTGPRGASGRSEA